MKKSITGIIVGTLLLSLLIGCAGGKTPAGETTPSNAGGEKPAADSAAGAPDPVTLKVMLFGDRPTGMDEVLAEFETRTKDTLNTKLNIEWSPLGDHKEKVKLKMAAGEEIDLVFDAPWANLRTLAPQGAYIELDSYFNNDEYPGLKKAFSQDILDSNRINGKIYAVPFTQYFAQADGVFIRKDLREKYGLPPIESYEDLEAFFKKVKENEKGVTPMAAETRRGFFNMFKPIYDHVMTIGGGGHWQAVLSEDRKQVLGVVILGDSDEQFAALPAPYNDRGTLYGYLKTYADWNQYLEPDSISQKDKVGLFASGKAASVETDIAQYSALLAKLKAGVPDGELEFFAYRDCFQTFEKGCISTDYVAPNSVAIPATSKHPDRVMKFLDWIFQNQENHDLFEYGIEGVHWEAAGDNGYKALGSHNFPGYELTWNPNFIRLNTELDENARKYYEYLADPSTYYKRPLAGFKFDPSPVKSEVAKVQPKYDEFYSILQHGLYKDPYVEARKANEEWKALGLEKIREEIVKQLQAYIDAGGN
ncbi:extracellular solute-binding protein [Paenibacillus tarimensis]